VRNLVPVADPETTSDTSLNPGRPAPDPYLATVAAGATWVISNYRVSPSTLWDGDFRVAQCLSNQSLGWDGIVTAILSRSARLVPLGTEVTRIGLLSCLGAALSTFLVYRIAFAMLSRHGNRPLFSAWLSFGTALLFAMSPSVALQSSLPPGPFPAVALLLATLYVAIAGNSPVFAGFRVSSKSFILGLLVAATTLELAWVGTFAALLAATATEFNTGIRRTQALRESAAGVLVGWGAIGLPWFLTRRTAMSLALSGGDRSESVLSHLSLSLRVPGYLHDDVGVLLLLVAAFGAFALFLTPFKRQSLWIGLLVLPGILLPLQDDASASVGAFRLLATVAVLLMSAVGLQQITNLARHGSDSRSKLAASLTVILQLTLALAHADEASYRADRYRSQGMEIFTDEAFADLPARSVLLLKDPRLIRRLAAAKMSEGFRPDLLAVPVDTATNRAIVSELLAREPTLASVLRELTINGRPSEFALSTLADERPVYLQFDPQWDFRLREHLLPLPFLSRLYSQALGRSDRASVLELSEASMIRAFSATLATDGHDSEPSVLSPMERRTRGIVKGCIQEQLTLLLSMGDRQTFDVLFADYERFEPFCPWAKRIKSRLANGRKPTVDAFDLLGDQPGLTSPADP